MDSLNNKEDLLLFLELMKLNLFNIFMLKTSLQTTSEVSLLMLKIRCFNIKQH